MNLYNHIKRTEILGWTFFAFTVYSATIFLSILNCSTSIWIYTAVVLYLAFFLFILLFFKTKNFNLDRRTAERIMNSNLSSLAFYLFSTVVYWIIIHPEVQRVEDNPLSLKMFLKILWF